MMDKHTAVASINTLTNENRKQSSSSSKSVAAPRHMNTRMVQNVLLIWLDNNIDEKNNTDCRNTVIQLRRIVNTIKTFTNAEECIEFINSMNDEKVCMIISGSLGQHTVPRIHNMFQVDSIFIFCVNKNIHEQWAKEWPKIKGVFIEISLICEALKQTAQQCEHNSISLSFMATNRDPASKKLDELDCSFMYTQLLKETLLTIKFEQEQIKQFINYCCDVFAQNEKELINVNKMERKYYSETPIWWYTYECFLYPMLNRALRTMDVDIIIKMGFFIADLHRHIEQLHSEQFDGHHANKSFIVYRGQGMYKTDFDQMMKTKGGLMSFNSFLSTSKNRDVSLAFAKSNQNNADLMCVLFVMTIDPSKSTTPFASINGVSYFKTEDEVLFSMHTVFRICEIKPIDGNNQFFQVNLILTSNNDKDLCALTDYMREEAQGSTEWDRLGKLLLKMGQFAKAEQVYEFILKQTTDNREKAHIYHQLGRIEDNQNEYKKAVIFYKRSLEIYEKTLSSNHSDLVKSYDNIGAVYYNIGEYSKALSYYNKSLEIKQKTLPPNHSDLGESYDNIGLVYYNIGEYSKALSYYHKALTIKERNLPPNHPDLAKSYNKIGGVYYNMGEFRKVLSYFEKSLEILQKADPPNHPSVGIFHNNIGIVHYNMGEYLKALSSHETALEIFHRTLPSNHPDLAVTYGHIGNVYASIGEYLKALSCFERAVDIGQCSLSSNHPHLQWYKDSLENVKRKVPITLVSPK